MTTHPSHSHSGLEPHRDMRDIPRPVSVPLTGQLADCVVAEKDKHIAKLERCLALLMRLHQAGYPLTHPAWEIAMHEAGMLLPEEAR